MNTKEKISLLEVRDNVIWASHIHGNSPARETILTLDAGDVIKLSIDGHSGAWVKMADGKDGRPTNGMKPIGPNKEYWNRFYVERRGDLVDIAVIS